MLKKAKWGSGETVLLNGAAKLDDLSSVSRAHVMEGPTPRARHGAYPAPPPK